MQRSSERIGAIDVLRGVAIIGTLGTNIWIFAGTQDAFSLFFAARDWLGSLDDLLFGFTLLLTNGKFLSLLAILFGIGIELQYRAARAAGRPWMGPYSWRNLLLLIEGFLHYLLVFEYDILIGYALAAWAVCWLVTCRTRTLVIVAVAMALLHAAFYGLLAVAVDFQREAAMAAGIDRSVSLHMHAGYLEQVAYRWERFWFFRQEALGVLPMNIALFSLGVLLARADAFGAGAAAARLRRRLAVGGMLLGVPLCLLMFVGEGGGLLAARYLFAPLMAVGYFGLFAIWSLAGMPGLLERGLAAIGRAALSCYVLQNVLCSILFYGWGLGLKGQLSAPVILLLWAALSVSMALLSVLWLRRFGQGPIEASWRHLSRLPTRG